MNKLKVKDSYGICLVKPVRKPGEHLKILLVKKRCSHYFCAFVHGNYNIYDDVRLRKMFNNMSVSEKTYILGGNFDDIWYKMWLTHPLAPTSIRDCYKCDTMVNIRDEYFYECERKYVDLYKTGKIRRLIDGSKNISGIWELPKGKRKIKKYDKIDEVAIDAAIREFHEEVCIDSKDYRFLDSTPIKFTIEDDGVIYNTFIYICELSNAKWEPSISFSKYSFFAEADDINWFSASMISNLNLSEKQKKLLLTQYRVLVQKYRDLSI